MLCVCNGIIFNPHVVIFKWNELLGINKEANFLVVVLM